MSRAGPGTWYNSWDGGAGGIGGGGAAALYAKSKVWSTDAFVAEFCDSFSEHFTEQSDVLEINQRFASALEYLCHLCGGAPLPPKPRKDPYAGTTSSSSYAGFRNRSPAPAGGVGTDTADDSTPGTFYEPAGGGGGEGRRGFNFSNDNTKRKELSAVAKALHKTFRFPASIAERALGPLQRLHQAVVAGEDMQRKLSGYLQWKMQYYLSRLLEVVAKLLNSLQAPGDLAVFPLILPQTGPSGTTLLVEYVSETHLKVTIFNPYFETAFHPKTIVPTEPSKIKQMIGLTLSDVPREKLISEAWWSMVILSARNAPTDAYFYTHFCEWLTGKTFEAQVKDHLAEGIYATPCYAAQSTPWKSLVHTLKFLLRKAGLSTDEVKYVRHHIKQYMLCTVEEDLATVKGIKQSSKTMIHAACQSTAMSLARNEKRFEAVTLQHAKRYIDHLHGVLHSTVCEETSHTTAPALLDVTSGWDRVQQPDTFPLMECFRRLESVDAYAGAVIEQARVVPTNFLRIPAKVSNLAEIITLLNEAVHMTSRLVLQEATTSQLGHVRNALTIHALIASLVLDVLPVPLSKAETQRSGRKCIWTEGSIRYGQQLHLLKRLSELGEYFIRATYCLAKDIYAHSVTVVVTAALSIYADAIIRRVAEDSPSLFSVHYSGSFMMGRKTLQGFGIGLGAFALLSANQVTVCPTQLPVRRALLDYVEDTLRPIPSSYVIFQWEVNSREEDLPLQKLLRQIAGAEAFAAQDNPIYLMADVKEGIYTNLMRYFPEVRYFRNLVVMGRIPMSRFQIPENNNYLANLEENTFRFDLNNRGYAIYGPDGNEVQMAPAEADASYANPQVLCAPYPVHTEDDVLHIKSLITFGNVMGQRDSELLLSYLTVPYLRIPLVLRFFATEDRISCLKSESVQQVFASVLFEPGKFLNMENAVKPIEMVPAENPDLIASVYGHLMNELFHSPDGVVQPVLKLIQLASELDSGTVDNTTTTTVILYLLRILARCHAFIIHAIDMLEAQLTAADSGKPLPYRGLPERRDHVAEDTLRALRCGHAEFTELIHTAILPMLDTWTAEVVPKLSLSSNSEEIDKFTHLACSLHAHRLFLIANTPADDYSDAFVAMFLSSFSFLSTRYTWGSDGIRERPLYMIMQTHRRPLVRYLTLLPSDRLSVILNTVVRITTSSSGRADGGNKAPWGLVAGADCVGRFARLEEDVMRRAGREKGVAELLVSAEACLGVTSLASGVVTVAEGLQEVELNLHTFSLTFKSAHLRAVPTEIAQDVNMMAVFMTSAQGKQRAMDTMQCAVVEETQHRLWIRLVGQDHDVQFWRTPDQRFPIPHESQMRFYPDDLAETEKWVVDLFEPIRTQYFERSFWDPPIFCLIQERKLTESNSVATLSAIDSQTGRKLKEVYCFRDCNTVHVYDVFSYGRRFYRRLVFSSDNRFCLMQLHPAIDKRTKPWPSWGRHLAGDADPDAHTESGSAVILRHATHPQNVSRSTETFIPPYVLHGLIPYALIETHQFWQDEDDNLRGYPLPPALCGESGASSNNKKKDGSSTNESGGGADSQEETPDHLLWIHWEEASFDPLANRNTCVRVYRFARKDEAPRASDDAAKRSNKNQVAIQEVDGELEVIVGMDDTTTAVDPAAPVKDPEEERADLETGMYRQSSVVPATHGNAVVEDQNLLLINLMYARAGTPLHNLAKIFTRIELLSHVLVWTSKTDYVQGDGQPMTLDLIQLPRLKLTFTARLGADGHTYDVYSMDHATLCITNRRSELITELLQGVPHSLLLADANQSISILVPSLNFVRPPIASSPFSTELVLNRADEAWYKGLDTRYYLYPVHVSSSFVFTPTLASALYLMLLRYCHRQYADVFRLAGSIGTDVEFSVEEQKIFGKLSFLVDANPDAVACRAKISLLVANSQVEPSWYVPDEVAEYIQKLPHVSVSCRLTQSEERRLLYLACSLMDKMDIIREYQKQHEEAFQLAVHKTVERAFQVTPHQHKMIKNFFAELSGKLRDKLDVRVSQADLERLLILYNSYAKTPTMPYYNCLLRNRKEIIDAEMAYLEAPPGTPFPTVTLSIPQMGKDIRWLFYTAYDALSAKPPGGTSIQHRNSDGRPVAMSQMADYYYCGGTVRTEKMCGCGQCGAICGPVAGCPCAPCEAFNRETGQFLRQLIPQVDGGRSMRSLSFYEAFQWATELFNRWFQYKPSEKPYQDGRSNMPVSLREPNNSFLRYYELLTGTTKMKICSSESGQDFAELMFHFSREARNPAAGLGHLGHFLVSTPEAWAKLTRYNRTSKLSLEQRTQALYNSILSAAAQFQHRAAERAALVAAMPTVEFPSKLSVVLQPRVNSRTVEIPLHLTTILPIPNDTDCDVRTLAIPDHSQLAGATEITHVSQELLSVLADRPLAPAIPEGLLCYLNRSEQGLPTVPAELPFDLSRHEQANKTVARDMIHRLENDMRDFATRANESKIPKLSFMGTAALVREMAPLTGESTKQLRHAKATLEDLISRLRKLREEDQTFLAEAMPLVVRTANFVDVVANSHSSSLLLLRRFANKECTFTLDYLVSSLVSSTCLDEWKQLNPFLNETKSKALVELLLVTILRANRVGHINRACDISVDLLSTLSRVTQIPEALAGDATATANYVRSLISSASQKADSLADQLDTARCYIDRTTLRFDPRFLLFEYTWNLVLRDRQREIIVEMRDSVRQNHSIVKQMIMGAGKTTVVGPLLGMMLANGKDLVIQVVPPALLDFTRAVLRTTFSSVTQKQIFTFLCDRSSEVDSEILSKFQHARDARGIIVTTPSSVKSIFLKFVERLNKIADADSLGRHVNDEREAKDLLKVIMLMRKSMLIMDEVDMLLHPLKSELNFPIGAKDRIDFTPTRWKLPIHLLDAIFYFQTNRVTSAMKDSPQAAEILHEFKARVREGIRKNALQEMPHVTLLNLSFYDHELKPVLARWAALFIKSQHFIGLSDADTISYITKRPTDASDPGFVARIKSLEPDHIKLLNLTFDWLSCFLPHVLQKIDRVSFGIMNAEDMRRARASQPQMPHSRFVTAIPFIGKDLPSQSSEFAHPDVVIGLTILAYRYEGLRQMDFAVVMKELHAAVEKEVGRFSQRRTNIMFTKWVGASGGRLVTSYSYDNQRRQSSELAMKSRGDGLGLQPSESILFDEAGNIPTERIVDVLPLKLLKQANQAELEKLFKLFRRTAEVIHWYLCESIFPEFMRHQHQKLSASGQELGGSMIFDRRLGFSGTPSDLLPVELGRCAYEKGTDGELIHTLTDPNVMSYSVVANGWSVRGLLDWVAKAEPPFHALIDTGALVTGMSNFQVAEYLLKHGLEGLDGVVFLDEHDRKMILVRATGRVLKVAECGIPKVRRFAFYDQVHTTGMDIDHTPNAVAVQTLGKDMTFRDYSQGAYRMRGIGQGQTVQLLIIPEVLELIYRSLKKESVSAEDRKKQPPQVLLQDVTAWLLVNSIRSEHTQHNQLCMQSCANVWRKEAFEVLAEKVSEFTLAAPPSEAAMKALDVFRENVDFNISVDVPQPRLFSECVKQFVAKSSHLISSTNGRAIVDGIIDQTVREDEIENPVIDVQMVQEQEEEKETEAEQEKEQEIEIEKFVDLQYTRDEETFVSWKLDHLRNPALCSHFYPLSEFHLYKRRPIEFPDTLFLSKNFFNKKFSGHRRIKNVIVALEWIPSVGQLVVRETSSCDYGSMDRQEANEALRRTIDVVGTHQKGFNDELVLDLLRTALHLGDEAAGTTASEESQKSIAAMLESKEGDTATTLNSEKFYEMLAGNAFRKEQTGRYFVVVSLLEAETLRRVIHLRSHDPFLLPGSDTAVSLKIVPSQFITIDTSQGYRPPLSAFVPLRSYQCLRFFDCDLHFSEQEFGLLLRSLHGNPSKIRQAFFQQVIGCRRRARQRWERTPIALLFVMKNALTLFHQRAIGLCIRRFIESRELSLGDAFMAFNSSHTGVLSADEIWGGAAWCELNLTVEDVLDFIDVADSSHDGLIQYPDFLSMLTGNRDHDEDNAAAGGGGAKEQGQPDSQDTVKRLPTILPHGAEQLRTERAERQKQQRLQEAEANRELESENQRVMDEIEGEQISEELNTILEVGNPALLIPQATKSLHVATSDPIASMTFQLKFTEAALKAAGGVAPAAPRLLSRGGADKVVYGQPNADGSASLMMSSNSSVRVSLKVLKRFLMQQAQQQAALEGDATTCRKAPTSLSRFSLSAEFSFPNVKSDAVSMAQLEQQSPLAVMASSGKPFNFANWETPVLRFIGFNATNTPSFEAELFGGTPVQQENMFATGAKATTVVHTQQQLAAMFGGVRPVASNNIGTRGGRGGSAMFQQQQQINSLFGNASSGRGRGGGGGGFSFGAGGEPGGGFGVDTLQQLQTLGFGGANNNNSFQPFVSSNNTMTFGATGFGLSGAVSSPFGATGFPAVTPGSPPLNLSSPSGGGEAAAGADAAAAADALALHGPPGSLHVMRTPKCSSLQDCIGFIESSSFVITDFEKSHNAIDGVTYEWTHITYPMDGWVVFEKNGQKLWERLQTCVKVEAQGKVVIEQVGLSGHAADLFGKFAEPLVQDDPLELEGKQKSKKTALEIMQEENFGSAEMAGDVTELMEAVRKAKRLRSGDKVTRNKECWDRGDEDGGAGKVGKVLRVEGEKVHVSWPNGNKGQYEWGAQGKFELIKVADADSDDEGDEREVLNDERWVVELRKGGQKCNHCNALKLEPGNWFRCNHCESFHLCKKCFRGGQHNEHDFTDMRELAIMTASEFGPGVAVRIKMTVQEPKFGWESSFPGATGVILDMDQDDTVVVVEMDHDRSEFRADASELEVVKNSQNTADEAKPVGKYPSLTTLFNEKLLEEKKYYFLGAAVRAAKRLGIPKYAVNDLVFYNYHGYGNYYAAVVRSVDPENRTYTVHGDDTGIETNVKEANINPAPYKVGDKVRLRARRHDGSPGDLRPQIVGSICTIQRIHCYSQKMMNLMLMVNNTFEYVRDDLVDVVGNGKWSLIKAETMHSQPQRSNSADGLEGDDDDANADNNTAADVPEPSAATALPSSSNVIVERAFVEGQQHITVFIRDDLYDVDLATNEVKRSGRYYGRLLRDPPEPFRQGDDKVVLDDGQSHTMSLVVDGATCFSFCDGRQSETRLSGVLQSVQNVESREVLLAAAMALPVAHNYVHLLQSSFGTANNPFSNGLFGQANNGQDVATKLQRDVSWIQVAWGENLRNPARSSSSSKNYNDGGSATPFVEDMYAWLLALAKHAMWHCRQCKHENVKWAKQCAKCRAPREEKTSRLTESEGRFRSSMERGRSAALVRAKLQGKLRAQCQKELDNLEELAMNAQRMKDSAKPRTSSTAV